MATTHFQGPLVVGTQLASSAAGTLNTGTVQLVQVGDIAFDATLVQNLTFTLPANARIIGFDVDVTTAYNSATSATLTIGTASAGTQYVGSVNAKTGGRATLALTSAQVAAMKNITTNTSVIVTVTSVGQPTAGAATIAVRYIQN